MALFNNVAANPVDATTIGFFESLIKLYIIMLYKYVFPDPPGSSS